MTLILTPKRISLFSYTDIVRYSHTKHWNPKFKKERREKVIPFEEMRELSEDEKRMRLKERGIFPSKPWLEKPTYLSCTGSIFEAYVPPEGDGKFTTITGVSTFNFNLFVNCLL